MNTPPSLSQDKTYCSMIESSRVMKPPAQTIEFQDCWSKTHKEYVCEAAIIFVMHFVFPSNSVVASASIL